MRRNPYITVIAFLISLLHAHLLDRFGAEKMAEFALGFLFSWPVTWFLYGLAIFFLILTIRDWDQRKAESTRSELEQFARAGKQIQRHKIIAKIHHESQSIFVNTGNKYFKWLALENEQGEKQLNANSIAVAEYIIGLFKTCGYVQGCMKTRRFIAKGEQKTLTWRPF